MFVVTETVDYRLVNRSVQKTETTSVKPVHTGLVLFQAYLFQSSKLKVKCQWINQMHIVTLTWELAGSWSLSCCWFGRNQSWSEVSNGTGSLGTRRTGCFEPRDWEKADKRKRTTTGRWWTRTSGVSPLAAPDWWQNLDAPTRLERWEVSWGGRWPERSPSAQLERDNKKHETAFVYETIILAALPEAGKPVESVPW